MTDLVKQITDAIESTAQITLGDEYKLLSYKWDVAKNGETQNKKRYGCIPQAATSNDGLTRFLDVQQIFEFILHEKFVLKDGNDRVLTDKVEELFDKMDDVATDLANKKAGLPSVITLITFDGTAPPEIDEPNKTVTLRMSLNVRYRKQL